MKATIKAAILSATTVILKDHTWRDDRKPTAADGDAFGKVWVLTKNGAKLLRWDSDKAQSKKWMRSSRPEFLLNQWITDRRPTIDDGDTNGWVWGRSCEGTVETYTIDNIGDRPWMPIERPTADDDIDVIDLLAEIGDAIDEAYPEA